MRRGLWHLLSQVSRTPPREDLSAAGTFDPPLLAACLWPPELECGASALALAAALVDAGAVDTGRAPAESLAAAQETRCCSTTAALASKLRSPGLRASSPRLCEGPGHDMLPWVPSSLPLKLHVQEADANGSAGPRCCAHGARKCNVQGCHRFARGSVAEDDLGPAGRRCPQHMGAQNRPARQHSSTVESTRSSVSVAQVVFHRRLRTPRTRPGHRRCLGR